VRIEIIDVRWYNEMIDDGLLLRLVLVKHRDDAGDCATGRGFSGRQAAG
jgi:hypothetical protein